MPPKAIGLAGGAALLGGAIGALLWLTGEPARTGLLRPDDPDLVAQGARIYRESCASCHGASLEGQPDWQTRRPDGMLSAPPHDETGHTWHHSDQVLFEITKYGIQRFGGLDYKSEMPAFEGILTNGELVAVLSYIKSRWPAESQEYQDRVNAQDERAASEN